MIRFELESLVEAPTEQVFDLSLSVDLHLRSMAGAREVVLRGRTTGLFEEGEQVTWRAWHFGIPWRMTSAISQLDRPTRFIDQQVSGPFRSFHHEHLFEVHDRRTLMRDIVSFTAPYGPLGRLAEKVFLERYMRQLIIRRNRVIIAQLA